MQRNRGKQQNGKDERSLQENERYQGNISCKDGLVKVARIHRRTVQKDLHNQDNHNGMITQLEPDMECEVKWALESITMNKASGSNGISVELFQIL